MKNEWRGGVGVREFEKKSNHNIRETPLFYSPHNGMVVQNWMHDVNDYNFRRRVAVSIYKNIVVIFKDFSVGDTFNLSIFTR